MYLKQRNGLRLTEENGFTLIEILIAMTLLVSITSYALLTNLDTFQKYIFRSEQSVIVGLLSRARSESMNNINKAPHGLCYTSSNNTYTLFEGLSYALATDKIIFNSSKTVSITSVPNTFSCTNGPGIVFAQLSGNSTPIQITITQGTGIKTITINYAGAIIW